MKKPIALFFALRTLFLLILSAMPLAALPHREEAGPAEAGMEPSVRPERRGDILAFGYGDHEYELDLRDLSCVLTDRDGGPDIVVSRAAFRRARYLIDEALSEVVYPKRGLTLRVRPEGDALVLEFASDRPQSLAWPSVPAEKEGSALLWPQFEGNYIPLSDRAWTDYLSGRKWNTTQDQYLPFWGIERGKRTLSYLIENPFHNEITFTVLKKAVRLDFTHRFPDNADLSAPIAFRLYLDRDASPVVPAKRFRRYLEERNEIVTLEDKMKTAPSIARLIGAPHAYVWDGRPLTMADVNEGGWIPLAKALVRGADSGHGGPASRIMAAVSDDGAIRSMAETGSAYPYLRRDMVSSLSDALRSPRLYDESVWPMNSLPGEFKKIAERLLEGDRVEPYEAVRLNGFLLYSSFPDYLADPYTWGNGVSTRMIDALARSGMDRFLLTCDDVDRLDARPWAAAYAAEKGYALGPYDSYDAVHDPDAAEWSTAVFDRALYETGAIIGSDGQAVKGFQGVGYSVSPIAVAPYLKKRVAENFRKVPSSYYFIDGDAFGMYYDDYRPGRILGESRDAAARLDGIRWIFQTYKVPVGSEGGSYLFAPVLAVAEGVFFPVLPRWADPDLGLNELSKYFLGRPFPADESEQFFMPAEMKEKYARLFSDPRFRLPLYETVFHDSVITTSHYASPSLKFTNIAETTALTELLYQVAPMYHFNLSYFEKIKETIRNHVTAFEKTHSYSYRYPLEDFAFLTTDRTVQRTRFGELELIGNFRDEDFRFEGRLIPARSVAATYLNTGETAVYREPRLAEGRGSTDATLTVPALITALEDRDWEARVAGAEALANRDGDRRAALPALTRCLEDTAWQVRRAGAYALATLGGDAKAAASALVGALGDTEWHVRRAAAVALGSIGSSSSATVRALETRRGDPELQVRMAAEWAISKLRERRLRRAGMPD